MDERQKGVRLWCVAARKAPIIGVIARYRGEKSWGCVLRWNWEKRKVEEGAWTTMRIHAGRCVLSKDGEFLVYHATGPNDGPFCAKWLGGAFAVSRLPWLSALTNTDTFGPAGGGVSRDALSEREQKKLWGLFDGAWAYDREEHWPRPLGGHAGRGLIEVEVLGIDAIAPEETQVVLRHAAEFIAQAELEFCEVRGFVHQHDSWRAGDVRFFDPFGVMDVWRLTGGVASLHPRLLSVRPWA